VILATFSVRIDPSAEPMAPGDAFARQADCLLRIAPGG
jgi:hypothetical protein